MMGRPLSEVALAGASAAGEAYSELSPEPVRIADCGFLSDAAFADLIALAPLVCVDLIIRDDADRIFVALRALEPARGLYFVPGGRIRKNETIRQAFDRIAYTEIGRSLDHDAAGFMGVFEHFYDTNGFGQPDFGTHCVVLAYEVVLMPSTVILDAQHVAFRWMTQSALLAAPDVHDNTKAYFKTGRV